MTEGIHQYSIDDIEAEIDKELGIPESQGFVAPVYLEGQEHASRKPFRINDFDSPRDREMAGFTPAKILSEYIFIITEKSPKKYRWSIVTRIQNVSVEVVENLYRANFEREDEQTRVSYQKNAAVALHLLDFYTETARRKQAINNHQMEVISKQIAETHKLLKGWVRATKRKQQQ